MWIFFFYFDLLVKLTTTHFLIEFSLRETLKCFILTEDSKTVHFDIDEDGHHEISTRDSQSHEGSALFIQKSTNNICDIIGHFKMHSYVYCI